MLAFVASAEPAEQPAPAKCLKAEINPVTGHVLCIDPLGATIKPPEAALPCKKPEEVRPVELQPELHARNRGDVSLPSSSLQRNAGKNHCSSCRQAPERSADLEKPKCLSSWRGDFSARARDCFTF
ncbi:MAG: hypothetical protein WBW51_04405 [Methyloceanibacter sp.]